MGRKHKRKWAQFDRAFGKANPVPTGPLWSEIDARKNRFIGPIKPKYIYNAEAKRKELAEKRAIERLKNPPIRKARKKRKIAPHRAIRNTKEYRVWREAVLRQFNHTCSFCGSKERLELDHIEPVSKRPDLVMETSNARILCNPCHKTTDSYPVLLRLTK